MTPPSSEHYAELAALFTTVPEESTKPSIELLLPAHLPVQGGLWLVPYAGREAAGGTAILVRMHEDTVDVAAIGTGNIEFNGCTSMEDVLNRISGLEVHWIIQPPADADPTSLLHCDADSVTLLSGADQAAVVGAYRLLKGLITSAGSKNEVPTMRLVVVGAEERSASDAASRIVQTAQLQLNVKLDVGPALPAMGSTSKVISQVSFSRGSNVVDLMGKIRNANSDEEMLETTARIEKPIVFDEPVVSFVGEMDAVPTEQNATDSVAETAPEPIVAPVEERPSVETIVQSTTMKSEYASYVDGLLAIAPRCPEHDHVELAVDMNGRLHVLADANDLRDVAIVSAWIVRHGSLLAMACGGLKLTEGTTPVQHIFTDDAVAVADLHGTDVRMHLLAEVQVEGATGIFCTPLN
ncbi:MAG TPA: hypothetical protein EYO01_05405 [Phycisphaerales bacterium]|nr:hypothetical protein [Phycisphaerales bacterium]HIB00880.1 hypothetical protein [Phycisphaerales bacterium]HIB49970.1 hypothetical protein [Phycisphaerales bacterium]HIN84527.1 hypothetical protein [Phycisphaerales bacterium]HIO52952.1 hypothetical protein [Phycisphaerales bacterium]